MISRDFTISLLLIILGGWLLTVDNSVSSIIGAIAASIGALYLIVSWLVRKCQYRHPFSKIIYWLEDQNEHDHKTPIQIKQGDNQIKIELIPRVKYTISEVSLRFFLDSQTATDIKVFGLEDTKMASVTDYHSKDDTVGGYMGSYNPHRVVSKNDTVDYSAGFSVNGSWQGNLELHLRITTEEFGRHIEKFRCELVDGQNEEKDKQAKS